MTRFIPRIGRERGVRSGLAAAFIALGIASGLLLAGCGKKSEAKAAPKAPAIAVRTAPLVRQTVERTIEITGTIYGQEEITISAKVGGRVQSILADLGDLVQPGQTLAQLEKTDLELQRVERVESASAALAKVGLTELPPEGASLDELPTVQRARAEEANALARLERTRTLQGQASGGISAQDIADIETQWRVASQNASVELLNARATIAEARTLLAGVRIVEQQLTDATVVAPIGLPLTFRVAARLVSTGEIVTPGQPLFRLVSLERVKFRGAVPERFAGLVKVGAPVRLMVDSSPEPFPAVVTRVAPQVDIATRSFEVEIEADNPDGLLKPGSFARAGIVTGTSDGVAFVPPSALLEFAGVQRVFTADAGKAKEWRVRSGERVGEMIEIVEPKDIAGVVVLNPGGLTDGAVIEESKDQPASAATEAK